MTFDYLIVGAGFCGSTLAERLARAGKNVLIVDRRQHVGGNAYDHYNDDGLLVHRYGPHIFHTNSRDVFEYLSMFTAWRPYEHRVRASVNGQLVPIPINLDTINALYGTRLTSFEVEAFLAERAEQRSPIATSEDVIISKVGRELYELFFQTVHAEAVGARPERARRPGDRSHPSAYQPRRPLLQRHVPGDAASRLYPHVPAHARPPAHQGPPQYRLRRDRGGDALRRDYLHRPY